MKVSFRDIRKKETYSRPRLAQMWGYNGYQALARGVVTPVGDNKIILFVTENKRDFQEQYQDHLEDDVLRWEGPTDHFAEDRMLAARSTNEEIHIFYRKQHHTDFIYLGNAQILEYIDCRNVRSPSRFVFRIF